MAVATVPTPPSRLDIVKPEFTEVSIANLWLSKFAEALPKNRREFSSAERESQTETTGPCYSRQGRGERSKRHGSQRVPYGAPQSIHQGCGDVASAPPGSVLGRHHLGLWGVMRVENPSPRLGDGVPDLVGRPANLHCLGYRAGY